MSISVILSVYAEGHNSSNESYDEYDYHEYEYEPTYISYHTNKPSRKFECEYYVRKLKYEVEFIFCVNKTMNKRSF